MQREEALKEKGILHFNQAIHDLITEIIQTVSEFSDFNARQILINASRSRKRGASGTLAYVVPLRFKEGSPVDIQMRGNRCYHYHMAPYYVQGQEMLYIINFVLPKFMNLSVRDKLETIIHELYHINPQFNGDFRRFPGRAYLHGHSMKAYDKKIAALTDVFLALPHDERKYAFLKGKMWQLENKYEKVVIKRSKEPRPTLLKVTTPSGREVKSKKNGRARDFLNWVFPF